MLSEHQDLCIRKGGSDMIWVCLVPVLALVLFIVIICIRAAMFKPHKITPGDGVKLNKSIENNKIT